MHVSDILKSKGHAVVSVDPHRSVAEAAALMAEHRIGALLVRDAVAEAILGVLSEREIVHGLVTYGSSCLGLPVSNLMARDVVSCHPDDTITAVMTGMTEQRNRHLPVMADERLVGIVSIGDVVKHRLGEIESEARQLRDYITTA